MSSYILAIDISSEGTKSILYDRDLKAAGAAFEEANILTPNPGEAVQEPDDLTGSVRRTIERVLSDSGVAGTDVAVIGVTGQTGGIIGVKEDGTPSTCYDTWLDTRCAPQADAMKEKAGADIMEITGAPAMCGAGAKILWWKENNPETYKETARFVPLPSYIAMRLGGLRADEAFIDDTSLAYAGFADNKGCTWSETLLKMFDVDSHKMPKIVRPTEIVGKLRSECADATGIPEGTPIIAGLNDTSAALYGSGLTRKGSVIESAAATGTLAGVTDAYSPDRKNNMLLAMRAAADGLWYSIANVEGGALALRWYKDTLTGGEEATYEELDAEAADVPKGSLGVIFVPRFSGISMPQDPRMKASYIGLDWTTSRAHMYRAILEGTAYQYRRYLSAMKEVCPDLEYGTVHSSRGAVRSDLANQITACVLGCGLDASETVDSAPLGVAAAAGSAAGLISDPDAVLHSRSRTLKSFAYNEEHTKAYEPYYEAYLDVVKDTALIYRNKIYAN